MTGRIVRAVALYATSTVVVVAAALALTTPPDTRPIIAAAIFKCWPLWGVVIGGVVLAAVGERGVRRG